MRVWVTIPTYMEVENIDLVVRRVRDALPDARSASSTTAAPTAPPIAADALAAELGNMHVLRRPAEDGARERVPRGLRRRHRPGIRRARRDRCRPVARPGRPAAPAAGDRGRSGSRDRLPLRRRRHGAALAAGATPPVEGRQPLRVLGTRVARARHDRRLPRGTVRRSSSRSTTRPRGRPVTASRSSSPIASTARAGRSPRSRSASPTASVAPRRCRSASSPKRWRV